MKLNAAERRLLREASRRIGRLIAEGENPADRRWREIWTEKVENWARNINAACDPDDPNYDEDTAPMVSIGDWSAGVESVRYDRERDIITVNLDDGPAMKIKDALNTFYDASIDGSGFYFPVEKATVGDEPASKIDKESGGDGSVLFWER